VDKAIGAFKAEVSAATARSCRSVISGGSAVRVLRLRPLENDAKAWRRDLAGLVYSDLTTGVRIGEALAVVWSRSTRRRRWRLRRATAPPRSEVVATNGQLRCQER
jgi:hypothetical protein